jgi:hypothetical protein
LRGGSLQKSRLCADSLVPPIDDFGYAGTRQLIRVRVYCAQTESHLPDQETMP